MDDLPALSVLRRLWLGVAAGLVVVTALVLVAATDDAVVPPALPLALVAVASVAAVIGARAVDRFFAASPPADDDTALAELRQRAYLVVGIAEAPVLLGVAIAFVLGPRWAALVGGAGGLATLAVVPPTVGRLARIDAAWREAGHDVSLLRATGLRDSDARDSDGD